MERNVRSFNILSPLQAFQFATFLLRLRARSDAFVAEFDDKYAASFTKSLLDPESPLRKWAMHDSDADKQGDAADEQDESKMTGGSHRSTPIPATPSLDAIHETAEDIVVEDLRARLAAVDVGSQDRGQPSRLEAS